MQDIKIFWQHVHATSAVSYTHLDVYKRQVWFIENFMGFYKTSVTCGSGIALSLIHI